MSHIIAADFEGDDCPLIENIPALARAVSRLPGLEFRQDQTHYNTWATDHGKLVGDYPVPEGWTEKEIIEGKCAHAIVIKPEARDGRRLSHYEIGVVPSKKTAGAFTLIYDFYGGAIDKLATAPGTGRLSNLYMYYQIEAARDVAKAKNQIFREKVETDGSITCEAVVQRSF